MNYSFSQATPQQQQQQFMYNNPFRPQQQYNAIAQVRPVSSIEEVRAHSIDFDGSVFYFPDIANKRIYTKYISMDGTVAINTYELIPTDQINSSSYVTRQEFETAMSQIKEILSGNNQEMLQSTVQPQQPNFQF